MQDSFFFLSLLCVYVIRIIWRLFLAFNLSYELLTSSAHLYDSFYGLHFMSGVIRGLREDSVAMAARLDTILRTKTRLQKVRIDADFPIPLGTACDAFELDVTAALATGRAYPAPPQWSLRPERL